MRDPVPKRTPPIRGLYPSVLLGDGQWERVIHALWQRNTKADAALALRITKQVEKTRARRQEDR